LIKYCKIVKKLAFDATLYQFEPYLARTEILMLGSRYW